MSLFSRITPDAFSSIVADVLHGLTPYKALELRRVSRHFNHEVLRNSSLVDFRSTVPSDAYGPLPCFYWQLASARYLHSFLAKKPRQPAAHRTCNWLWAETLKTCEESLLKLVDADSLTNFWHERYALVEDTGDHNWRIRRVMCEAVVSFMGPANCERFMHQCIGLRYPPSASIALNILYNDFWKTPYFWLLVAACHTGHLPAMQEALSMLGVPDNNPDPGARWLPQSIVTTTMSDCMYVAARKGHIEIVRSLIKMGAPCVGRSDSQYGYSATFDMETRSPLSGAVECGSLEMTDLLLDHAPHLSRYTATLECIRHTDCTENDKLIFKRLLDGWQQYATLRSVQSRILSKLCAEKNVGLLAVMLDESSTCADVVHIQGTEEVAKLCKSGDADGQSECQEIIRCLFKSVRRPTEKTKARSHTLLLAIHKGNTRLVQEIGSCLSDFPDWREYSLLRAVDMNKKSIVRWLVEDEKVDLHQIYVMYPDLAGPRRTRSSGEVRRERTLGQQCLTIACDFLKVELIDFFLQRYLDIKCARALRDGDANKRKSQQALREVFKRHNLPYEITFSSTKRKAKRDQMRKEMVKRQESEAQVDILMRDRIVIGSQSRPRRSARPRPRSSYRQPIWSMARHALCTCVHSSDV